MKKEYFLSAYGRMSKFLLVRVLMFFLFLLLFCMKCFGTSFSYDPELKKIIQSPSLAKTAGVGILKENSKGEQFLEFEKTWTKVPAKIKMAEYIDLDTELLRKEGITGHRYLFLSPHETDEKGVIKEGAYFMAPINLSQKYIEALVNKKVKVLNPSLQYCETDQDCIFVRNSCQHEDVINKRYLEVYKNQYGIDKKRKCNTEIKKIHYFKLGCVRSFCERS